MAKKWFDFPPCGDVSTHSHGYHMKLGYPERLVASPSCPSTEALRKRYDATIPDTLDLDYLFAVVEKAFRGRKMAAVAVGVDTFGASVLDKNWRRDGLYYQGGRKLPSYAMTNRVYHYAQLDMRDKGDGDVSFQASPFARFHLMVQLATVERELWLTNLEGIRNIIIQDGEQVPSWMNDLLYRQADNTLYRNSAMRDSFIHAKGEDTAPSVFRKKWVKKPAFPAGTMKEISMHDVEMAVKNILEFVHLDGNRTIATNIVTLWVMDTNGDYTMSTSTPEIPSPSATAQYCNYARFVGLERAGHGLFDEFARLAPKGDSISTIENRMYEWVYNTYGIMLPEIRAQYVPSYFRKYFNDPQRDEYDVYEDHMIPQIQDVRKKMIEAGFAPDLTWSYDLMRCDVPVD